MLLVPIVCLEWEWLHGYLFEVTWRDLAARKQGFEPSEAHARFMAPLVPTLSGEPVVLHVPAGDH